MNNILITSAGRRVSLVRAFKKELLKIDASSKVFTSDLNPALSSASQIGDKTFTTPRIDADNYIDEILHICNTNNVKLVVPTIDTDLSILSKHKKKFLDKGIIVLVSDEWFINISNNKLKTHEFFKKYNLDSAKIYSKDNYELPLFIKPINGSNSVDNFVIQKEEELLKYHYENDDLYFFEYLDHNLYEEYTCDLYFNKRGKLKCVIPRNRIEVRGGEVSKAVTTKNSIKTFIEEHFSKLDGVMGAITLQLFKEKNGNVMKGIEINARFGGGFPLSYMAGGNYPKWLIEEYILNKEITYFNDWEENLLMLRYDNEILVHDYER